MAESENAAYPPRMALLLKVYFIGALVVSLVVFWSTRRFLFLYLFLAHFFVSHPALAQTIHNTPGAATTTATNRTIGNTGTTTVTGTTILHDRQAQQRASPSPSGRNSRNGHAGLLSQSLFQYTRAITTTASETSTPNEMQSNHYTTRRRSRHLEQLYAKRLPQGVIRKNDQVTVADFGTSDLIPVVDVCTICIVNYEHGDRVATSSCNHVFHLTCILEWLIVNRDCPNCRKSYVDPEAVGDVMPSVLVVHDATTDSAAPRQP